MVLCIKISRGGEPVTTPIMGWPTRSRLKSNHLIVKIIRFIRVEPPQLSIQLSEVVKKSVVKEVKPNAM